MKTRLLSINQKENATLTMSSREIAQITESRHSDVCVSIDRLMAKGIIGGYQAMPYTHPQNGQIYHEYHINKRDTYVIVAQLSPTKILNFPEKRMIECLERDRVLYRQSGNLLPYQTVHSKELFTVKTGTAEHGHNFTQTRVTGKGINWIASRYASELGL